MKSTRPRPTDIPRGIPIAKFEYETEDKSVLTTTYLHESGSLTCNCEENRKMLENPSGDACRHVRDIKFIAPKIMSGENSAEEWGGTTIVPNATFTQRERLKRHAVELEIQALHKKLDDMTPKPKIKKDPSSEPRRYNL